MIMNLVECNLLFWIPRVISNGKTHRRYQEFNINFICILYHNKPYDVPGNTGLPCVDPEMHKSINRGEECYKMFLK